MLALLQAAEVAAVAATFWDKALNYGGPLAMFGVLFLAVLSHLSKRDDKVSKAMQEQHDACNATTKAITDRFAATVDNCQESTATALNAFREDSQQSRKELHDLLRELKRP